MRRRRSAVRLFPNLTLASFALFFLFSLSLSFVPGSPSQRIHALERGAGPEQQAEAQAAGSVGSGSGYELWLDLRQGRVFRSDGLSPMLASRSLKEDETVGEYYAKLADSTGKLAKKLGLPSTLEDCLDGAVIDPQDQAVVPDLQQLGLKVYIANRTFKDSRLAAGWMWAIDAQTLKPTGAISLPQNSVPTQGGFPMLMHEAWEIEEESDSAKAARLAALKKWEQDLDDPTVPYSEPPPGYKDSEGMVHAAKRRLAAKIVPGDPKLMVSAQVQRLRLSGAALRSGSEKPDSASLIPPQAFKTVNVFQKSRDAEH